MLRATDALKVLVVEPVDICVRIAWVAGPAIDVASIHHPEIRDNVNVRFRDVWRNVRIEKSGNELGLHCVC